MGWRFCAFAPALQVEPKEEPQLERRRPARVPGRSEIGLPFAKSFPFDKAGFPASAFFFGLARFVKCIAGCADLGRMYKSEVSGEKYVKRVFISCAPLCISVLSLFSVCE